MHVMWYLLLPYYEKRKGKWEIVEKEVFDQGCRSSGKEGHNTACWTAYTVKEYGVVKTYGNNTCFLDDQKDPKCLKKCSLLLFLLISLECFHFFWISSVTSRPLSHPPSPSCTPFSLSPLPPPSLPSCTSPPPFYLKLSVKLFLTTSQLSAKRATTWIITTQMIGMIACVINSCLPVAPL